MPKASKDQIVDNSLQAPSRIAVGDDIQAVKALNTAFARMKQQLSRVIVGQQQVIEEVLVAIFCSACRAWPRRCWSARFRRCCT